jgi:hypothetical protein
MQCAHALHAAAARVTVRIHVITVRFSSFPPFHSVPCRAACCFLGVFYDIDVGVQQSEQSA